MSSQELPDTRFLLLKATLPEHDIVLLGVGHTNAHVLKMWRMRPLKNARLTCVSNFPTVTYSGMLPGVLAGLYPPQRMEIDLVRLCAATGAGLIVDQVTGLDTTRRELLFDDRPALPFDVLSIGIGSVPQQGAIEMDDTALAIKPMQTFLDRFSAKLQEIKLSIDGEAKPRPIRIAVVGAGVGGVEISFCLASGVRRILGEVELQQMLIDAGDHVATGTHAKTQRAARQEFQRRGVELLLGRRVRRIAQGAIEFDDGSQTNADLVLWAASASAPPLLSEFDLPKDERGFLSTRPTLQTTADQPIFAVGDTGTIQGCPLPKAGVYAVRQGPFLWKNIPKLLAGERLLEYKPQEGFLKLLNTGDGKALAEYKGNSIRASWCWSLKDYIDGRFMDMYQDYKPMEMASNASAEPMPMRCAGCGGKVSGSVLSRVLARLDIPPSEHVLLGLEHPDDAAIVQPPGGRPMTVTADFFTAPLEDPFLSGRIAALNSASDLFAMQAQPIAALTLATIPIGKPRKQAQLLYELLAGSLYEFRKMGATLIGGHTIEGPQTTIGFTMLADQGQNARTKGQLRKGDLLVISKPLGTGIMLVGQMQARCEARWWGPLMESMLLSNQFAAALSQEFDVSGLTDVTGFGLAGHLIEMLKASKVDCELNLFDLPLLDGAETLSDQGIESTLAPANRSAEQQIDIVERMREDVHYRVLFDPQTSGGMLLGVAPQDADALLRRLRDASNVPAAVIGEVQAMKADSPTIRLVGHARRA